MKTQTKIHKRFSLLLLVLVMSLGIMMPQQVMAQSANNALNFDGDNDYVDATNITSTNFGLSDFTIEFWMKTNSTHSVNSDIISKRSICDPSNFWNIKLENDGKLFFEAIEDAGFTNSVFLKTSSIVNDNIWHHISVTRNGTTIYIYLDGVSSATGAFNITNLDNTDPVQIGRGACSDFPWGSYYEGTIDEVRIWNIARTQAQIQATMNCELTGSECGLVAYYNFNEGEAGDDNTGVTTLFDQTSYSNDGTLYNFALDGSTSNWVGSDAFASCGPPNQPPEYVLLADKDVKIERQVNSEGNIHANHDIEFEKGKKRNPSTYTGNLTAVDDITIEKRNTIVGDATAGDKVKIKHGAEVTGTVTDHATVDQVSLPTLSFSAGGDDVTVPRNGSVPLVPGSYDDVKVKKRGTLLLSSGEYFMKRLETEKQSTLSFDVTCGPVTINVTKELEFGEKVEVIISSGDEGSNQVIFNSLQRRDLNIGEDSRVLGSIVAPKAEVELGKHSLFKGSIAAEEIKVEKGVTFLPHGSATPLSRSMLLVAEDPEKQGAEESSEFNPNPTEYELGQNFPNPFNPTTTIRYTLPTDARVKLEVYDVLGRLIAELVNGHIASGIHYANFDGSNLASGIYFYRLNADDGSGKSFTQLRKLLLMK